MATRKNEVLYVDNRKVSQNKNILGSLPNHVFTPADFKKSLARYRRLVKNFIDQNRQFYKDHGYDEKLDKEFKLWSVKNSDDFDPDDRPDGTNGGRRRPGRMAQSDARVSHPAEIRPL